MKKQRPRKRKYLTAGEEAAILARAEAYVNAQFRTMEKYGGAPKLSDIAFAALVLKCAKPAMEIAKWRPEPKRETTR